MTYSRIVLLKQQTQLPKTDAQTLVIDLSVIKTWLKRGAILKQLFRYRSAECYTHDLHVMTRPLSTAILVRFLARQEASLVDQAGHRQPLTVGYLFYLAWAWCIDSLQQQQTIKTVQRDLAHVAAPQTAQRIKTFHRDSTPAYLRTDLVFGLRSGGSVGHIAGVLNNLGAIAGSPIFLTTDTIPTVDDTIATHIIRPDGRFRDFVEVARLHFNQTFYEQAQAILQGHAIGFLYQRYAINNYAGLQLARHRQVPFVLEYNGSELWVNRNWGGRKLQYEQLTEAIELANLRGADLIVVVSQPLKDELIQRGIAPEKILVNPNGVNTERYSPQVDGTIVRHRLGLENRTVLGFIGTFGPWHGAEVLAEAFGQLLQAEPTYREKIHLLMIGDGVTMGQVRATLQQYDALTATTLTGTIPQAEGPAYLAACDLLVSPHVPNVDGSPFFGSPTKLFEYMAMGKGIVASDLEQIGEILQHNESAWLVPPKDVVALRAGLKQLIDDSALAKRLGRAARAKVVANYTWHEHTKKIIDKLSAVCSATEGNNE